MKILPESALFGISFHSLLPQLRAACAWPNFEILRQHPRATDEARARYPSLPAERLHAHERHLEARRRLRRCDQFAHNISVGYANSLSRETDMRGGDEWMGLCRMYREAQKEVFAAERDLLGPPRYVTGKTFERLNRALANLEIAFTAMLDYWTRAATN